MNTSWVHYCSAMMGTPGTFIFTLMMPQFTPSALVSPFSISSPSGHSRMHFIHSFIHSLATPAACRISQARDQTSTTAVTRATAVTTPDT